MHAGEIFVVYDFTTFTTNLQSLSEFLHGLADFYAGEEITVIDTFRGPITISLSDYLHAYATECNDSPKFDWFNPSDPDSEPITFTSGAGLLGIPGNITSSTLWHAIVLMCVIGSVMVKVVGDDAGAVLPEGVQVPDFIGAIGRFGDVSLPKSESWDYVDPEAANIDLQIWNYVKRQIYRLDNSIHTGRDPMFFPNPSLFMPGFADRFHRSTFIEDEFKARAKSADYLVRQCQKYRIKEAGPDALQVCEWYHDFITKPVKIENQVRREKGWTLLRFHKQVVDLGFEEWYRGLEGDFVTIPDFEELGGPPQEWKRMTPYVTPMTRYHKMLVELEWASADRKLKVVPASDIEMLWKFYNVRWQPLYDFLIYDTCPEWCLNLLQCSDEPVIDTSYQDQDVMCIGLIEDWDN
jgi:hypothetical protein